MANHGWVTVPKKLKQPEVDKAIRDLNQRVFKGVLTIEYFDEGDDPLAYGPHVWHASYVTGTTPKTHVDWLHKTCWINKGCRKFEARHGGGGDFSWWWDWAVLNEIAVLFDGMIGDDGVEETWPGEPNKYDTAQGLLDDKVKDMGNFMRKALVRQCFKMDMPPIFRKDLK